MFIGIALTLIACFIWGLIFVIPGFLVGFTPIEVALGRNFFFGLISIFIFFGKGIKNRKTFSRVVWSKIALYSLVVAITYYFFLVMGLRYSNPSVVTLISGLAPIAIAFYGNIQQKTCQFQQLIFPCLILFLGLVLVNIPSFTKEVTEFSLQQYVFGLCCGIFSLASWVWYVVSNAEFLKKNNSIAPSEWSTLLGVGTFCWVIVLTLIGSLFAPSEVLAKYYTWNSELKIFLIGVVVLGFLCSWVGSFLWNQASRMIPISLAGQLTIFETIFGLLFVYLIEQRLPLIIEFAGVAIILSGVVLTLNIFNKAQKTLISDSIH